MYAIFELVVSEFLPVSIVECVPIFQVFEVNVYHVDVCIFHSVLATVAWFEESAFNFRVVCCWNHDSVGSFTAFWL